MAFLHTILSLFRGIFLLRFVLWVVLLGVSEYVLLREVTGEQRWFPLLASAAGLALSFWLFLRFYKRLQQI